MDPNSVVFDLSSDEEEGWGENTGEEAGSGEDYGWIQELLDEVDKENGDSNTTDDVVMVNPKAIKNPNAVVKVVDDEVDDCVVLDGDPDKPVTVQNNPKVSYSEEHDELQVVGEKGQVACRDYPHPRHLCAKFPFSSTPHEKHCDHCHCYVCDSLSPCPHWDTGHCHATEKEEFWRAQRRYLKNGHEAAIPVPEAPTPQLTGLIQINQVPVTTQFYPNCAPRGHVPCSALIRQCSRETNFGISNVTVQSQNQRSGYVVPRNKFQSNLVLQHLRSADNIPRDRGHITGNAGPPVAVLKRTALSRTAASARAVAAARAALSYKQYCLSSNKYGSHYMRKPPSMSTQSDHSSMRQQYFVGHRGFQSNTYQFPFQPSMQTTWSNSVPSQPRISFQPNAVVSPQPNIGNAFVNSVTPQPQGHSYIDEMLLSPISSQPQVSFQPNSISSFANAAPSETQVGGQSSYTFYNYQNIIQQGNQADNFLDASLGDIDLSGVTATSQNSQQLAPGDAQLQSAGSMSHSLSVAGIDRHLDGTINPDSSDFLYDGWTLDDDTDVLRHSTDSDFGDSSIFFGM